jgi:hypothetical protein
VVVVVGTSCVCVVVLRVWKRGVVESEAQWRVESCNLAREGTCISYCLLLTSNYCSQGLEGTTRETFSWRRNDRFAKRYVDASAPRGSGCSRE